MLLNKSSKGLSGRAVAGGGMLSALSVSFIFLAAISPTSNIAIMSLTSLCIAVAIVKFGYKTALIVYTATSLISLIWPGIFFALSYLGFFGIYPIIKAYIENRGLKQASDKKSKIAETILKQISATFLVAIMGILSFLFFPAIAEQINEFLFKFNNLSIFLWPIIILAIQIIIYLFDLGLTVLITLYIRRLHGRI